MKNNITMQAPLFLDKYDQYFQVSHLNRTQNTLDTNILNEFSSTYRRAELSAIKNGKIKYKKLVVPRAFKNLIYAVDLATLIMKQQNVIFLDQYRQHYS